MTVFGLTTGISMYKLNHGTSEKQTYISVIHQLQYVIYTYVCILQGSLEWLKLTLIYNPQKIRRKLINYYSCMTFCFLFKKLKT